MQPWPPVLLSISATSAPVYSLLSTPLPTMEGKIHHCKWLLDSAIRLQMLANTEGVKKTKKQKKTSIIWVIGVNCTVFFFYFYF